MDREVIDINDPILQQEMVEADPEADYFELPPPPPDDREYQVKLLLGEKGPSVRRQERKGDTNGQRTGDLYLYVPLELHFIEPGQPWDNDVCFDNNVNSIIMMRSGTSKLHSILRAIGQPAMGRLSIADLRDFTVGVLAGEPIGIITGKWEASIKEGDEYRNILKGMKNFPLIDPQHPELGHSPWAEDIVKFDKKTNTQVGTGEMVRARFIPNNYLRR